MEDNNENKKPYSNKRGTRAGQSKKLKKSMLRSKKQDWKNMRVFLSALASQSQCYTTSEAANTNVYHANASQQFSSALQKTVHMQVERRHVSLKSSPEFQSQCAEVDNKYQLQSAQVNENCYTHDHGHCESLSVKSVGSSNSIGARKSYRGTRAGRAVKQKEQSQAVSMLLWSLARTCAADDH